MYSGTEVPYGWLLCDGTNGTPDLRNRFVLGSDGTDVNMSGGSRKLVISIDNLPAHKHEVKVSGSAESGEVTEGGVDVLKPFTDYIEATIDDLELTFPGSGESSQDAIKYRIPIYSPDEDTSGSIGGSFSIGGETGETGKNEDVVIPNPPYYKLMYIMKR